MPLSKDPQHGGVNADGSHSTVYCSYCYINGDFTFKGPVYEFQEHCRKAMVANGHHKIKAWLFTRGMKRLNRWTTKNNH